MASSVEALNPNAEQMSREQALKINSEAAKGLQAVLKSNLGPRGTIKLLVGGAGQLKITKDGSCLLSEMQIMHPTATLIARAANATDDSVGDGTTTSVLFTGELLKQAERYLSDGLHPRILVDGFDQARQVVLDLLARFKVDMPHIADDRETLCRVCHTALGTKLRPELAEQMKEIVTDALLTIRRGDQPIDLHMVEIMHMQHRMDTDTRLVKGLVLDHGSRHPDMPKRVQNAYIMTCNVSLEYEKSEVSSGFYYKDAAEREKMVVHERKFVDDKVDQVINFMKLVCFDASTGARIREFVLINMKGIDPVSLDKLARAGILALRRAKRRNMERLTLACGGVQLNSFDDLLARPEGAAGETWRPDEVLGKADLVYEVSLGEEKYTFVEGVENPTSCTILVKGQNPHTIAQMKDAIRDGLRAVKNAIDDKALVPGAGAFEIAAYHELMRVAGPAASKDAVEKYPGITGRVKLGVRAYAEAMLVVPKTLAENSGFDVLDTMLKLQEAYSDAVAKAESAGGKPEAVGLDLVTGQVCAPALEGIWDNVNVKRSVVSLSTVLAGQLLLVDELMRAGRGSRPSGGGGGGEGMGEED